MLALFIIQNLSALLKIYHFVTLISDCSNKCKPDSFNTGYTIYAMTCLLQYVTALLE